MSASAGENERASVRAREERRSLARLKPRHFARIRRFGAWAALLLPAGAIIAHDLVRRGERFSHWTGLELSFYLASAAFGALLWATLGIISAQRRGASRYIALASMVALGVLAVGAQAYTFERYAVYMDHQAVLVGTSMLPSIGQQLWSDRATFAWTLLPPLIAAVAMPFVLRSLAPSRAVSSRRAMDIAIIALIVITMVDPARGAEQGQPPDVLYLSAMGQLARAKWDENETVARIHPGPRTPIPVPALQPKPRAKRDVIFIVTESVRAMSTCVSPTKDCVITPFTNEAAPNRLPFEQMRALDSTTAVSLAVMWSGLSPSSSRADLHSAPLVWEFAHAAGLETAYWTSQNLRFGNSGAWIEGLPLTKWVSGTQIEPGATLEIGGDDGALVDVVLSDIRQLRSPFLGVVHLSNTHFPYKVDPDFAPFQPEIEATGPGYELQIKNRYHDAIYLQDRAVGRLVRGIREQLGANDRTIIVFTSDHGEQMREKGAVGHTGTLYEEEIRVPFWIDAPPGTLTAEERAAMAALAETPLSHRDVLPTLLDLVGVWEAPELASFKKKMFGESLLKGGTNPDRPTFLSNCTELWQCAFKNWGAMRGSKKLIGNQADHDWRCFDTAHDPHELDDLGPERCGKDLVELAEREGHGRPFGR